MARKYRVFLCLLLTLEMHFLIVHFQCLYNIETASILTCNLGDTEALEV